MAAGTFVHPAEMLRDKHAALAEPLRHNVFHRPLYLESTEKDDELRGDIYAVVEHPFATVRAALVEPAGWCDALILHINIKQCLAGPAGHLTVRLGRKFPQPVEDAYPLEFSYRVESATADYLEIRLDAPDGPMNTRDYRIRLRAIPVGDGRTFIHLGYTSHFGLAGRLAMNTYLATLASDKVGFTVTGRDTEGRPEYIGGARGMIERNTMRYYLAIDAYLDALALPSAGRLEKSLAAWFDATERHARQLHELERGEYLEMKRAEYQRQRAAK